MYSTVLQYWILDFLVVVKRASVELNQSSEHESLQCYIKSTSGLLLISKCIHMMQVWIILSPVRLSPAEAISGFTITDPDKDNRYCHVSLCVDHNTRLQPHDMMWHFCSVGDEEESHNEELNSTVVLWNTNLCQKRIQNSRTQASVTTTTRCYLFLTATKHVLISRVVQLESEANAYLEAI